MLEVLVTGADGYMVRNMSAFSEKRGFDVVQSDIHWHQIIGDLFNKDLVFMEIDDTDLDPIVYLVDIVIVKRSMEGEEEP